MSTSCRCCIKFADTLADEKSSNIGSDIKKACKRLQDSIERNCSPNSVAAVLAELQNLMIPVNKRERLFRILEATLHSEATPAVQLEFFSEVKKRTVPPKEEWTVDTDLGRLNVPKLCAWVGKRTALDFLRNKARPTVVDPKTGERKYRQYELTKCFGRNGGDANFVEWWAYNVPELRDILDTRNERLGFTYAQCKAFIEYYYDHYFLAQAKGEIVASPTKDRIIDKRQETNL